MDWDTLLCGERRRPVKKNGSSTDNRSEFEKDYHRIIVSASFRRLQDKTQVFPLDQSDFIRTRLTHSLEVSSIAKSLGQTIGHQLESDGRVTKAQASDIEDILLCSGLLHDIGNPPFGHFGETVIRQWFADHMTSLHYKGKSLQEWLTEEQREDLLHFEGNAQSLRVVTRLHYLVDENGMNLTKALCNTLIKYPVAAVDIDKDSPDIRVHKMGYFTADREIFQDIVTSTGAQDRRHPLVFLLEAADDIAYSTADLEDGFKKGIVNFRQLQQLISNNQYREKAGTKEYQDCEYAIGRLQTLFDRAVKNGESDPELYAVQNWIVTLQGLLIRAVTSSFLEHYDEIMAGEYRTDLFTGSQSEILVKVLKETAFENIFNSKGIIKLEIAADTMLGFLLERFAGAAVCFETEEKMSAADKKLMSLISQNYKRIYKIEAKDKSEGEQLYLRMLLVTDFIAGMTDHYAKQLYQELNGIY